MKYRNVGKWGLKVSCLGLGSFFTIGDTLGEDVSKDLIKTAYDKGINYFDTANGYGKGEAERLLGKYLKGYGLTVIVEHPEEYITVYSRCSRLDVAKGEEVRSGQPIAFAGDGNDRVLHFEIRENGVPQDPLRFMERLDQ